MEGGFQFDGVDIATLGLEYAPDNQNTFVYKPAQYTPSEETFEAHDGGYYYGMTVKPKDFVLRCIYQNTHVNQGFMTRLFHYFSRGKTGKLIFKNRQWCWYIATVMSVDVAQMTNYMNGVVTISMRAYYPFARTNKTYIDENDEPDLKNDLIWNTAMLEGIDWDLSKNFAEQPITEQKNILMYNCGTETAPVAIEIAGTLNNGVTISNITTGQKCEIIGLNTTGSDYLIVDSLSGKVMNVNVQQGTVTPGFLYHDNGFLNLASGYPVPQRSVYVTGESGSNQLTLSEPVGGQEIIGKYLTLYAKGQSAVLGIAILGVAVLGATGEAQFMQYRITAVSEDGLTITINEPLMSDVSRLAQVVTYNEIVVTPASGSTITKLVFRYQPVFA